MNDFKTRVVVDRDHLDGEYTGKEFLVSCEDQTSGPRRFKLYDDDNELYYQIVIDHCDEVAAEMAFIWFQMDSGTTFMKDITGDGHDFSMS